MRIYSALVILCATFLVSTDLRGGEAPLEIGTAAGTVEKADKDSLTIQPRGAGGKFAKKMVLKITGTSKLTVVSLEKPRGETRAGATRGGAQGPRSQSTCRGDFLGGS